VNEREYLAATLWTPAEWGCDRDGDWKTAVRIGAPTKAGDVGGREVKTAGDMYREPQKTMHVRADMYSETPKAIHVGEFSRL